MAKQKKAKFKEVVGLDIGSHSVKMVHLKKTAHGFKLLNHAIRSTVPEGLEYVLSDLRSTRFAPVIIEALKSMRLKSNKVHRLVSSIGGDNTSIKQIKTIFLPEDELESALFFEAKKHLPISGSDMLLDFQVISVEEKTNNMHILLAASTKDLLREHTDIIRSAGLTAGVVDVESLAIANSVALNANSDDGTCIILDIGAHNTNMVIYGQNAKFFSRDISWGGFNMTKEIMAANDIDYGEAENLKLESGLNAKKAKKSGSAQILDISEKSTEEQIALEVKRSLRFYVKEAGNSDFRKILLVGGGSKTIGLPEFLQSSLNIPCEVYNSFDNLETSETVDPQIATAIGLAMRPE